MFKKTLIAICLGAAGLAGTTQSIAAREVWVREAPPEPRNEVVPGERRGYAWAPGHWAWNHNRYVWVKGNWVRERRGYAYTPHAWVEQDGRWRMHGGNWARRDNDGDGVRNGRDARPNDPTRR